MTRSILLSIILLAALVLWMLSGIIFPSTPPSREDTTSHNRTQIKIEVEKSIAENVMEIREIQGSLEPFKTTTLRSEVDGIIKQINFEKGDFVKQGTLIIQIDERDLPEQLLAAKATLDFQSTDLKASKSLLDEGFETPLNYARKLSDYKNALSAYERIKKELGHTKVIAPTSGILNTREVEVGDYVAKNVELTQLVELDQLKVHAHVPQQIISQLRKNALIDIELEDEQISQGKIIFISSVADPGTRSFKIELLIDNPDRRFKAGRSVTIALPLGEADAHLVSPSLLIVDHEGNLAIKYIDDQNIVREATVKIVKSDDDGLWVSGLPHEALIIVQGAGFTTIGEHIGPDETKHD